MTISLPIEKIDNIKKFSIFCSLHVCSVRTLAKILGLLVNSSNGFLFAPLYYRKFQFCFIDALRSCSFWDDDFVISNEARSDLSWWINCSVESLSPVSLLDFKPDFIIHTDASLSGWGASISSGDMISGIWSSSDSQEHINFLELKAIYLAIQHFLPIIRNKNVHIFSDNSTCVFYLNKMGGTHSKQLCFLALKIWYIFLENEISCKAHHIKNSVADFLSRNSHFHEYGLSSSAFLSLQNILPFSLTIDLFASNKNNKLDCYASLLEDDHASFINAFSQTWVSGSYMFPPIPLIPKVVIKFLRDQVDFGVLITPAWHSISILPLIEKHLISVPIFIDSDHLIGCLPCRHPFHMMAWPISSNIVKKKGCLQLSQMHSSKALMNRHLKLIKGPGNPLLAGLIAKNLHPIFLLT